MYLYTILYSCEDESPSLVAIYSKKEDAEKKMNEILECNELRLLYDDRDNIVYTDNSGLISLSLHRRVTEEIREHYYVITQWQEGSVAELVCLQDTLEKARYYVENHMEHDCILKSQYDDALMWDNEVVEDYMIKKSKLEIISVHKYTVNEETI